MANALNQGKIEKLEEQLTKERERSVQLEKDGTGLFEKEEELVKLRGELQRVLEEGKQQLEGEKLSNIK